MAYTITNLINEYNSGRALILANSAIKANGLIAYSTYVPANKGNAHTYTLYSTLPTAGIRSLNDGIAVSDFSGSTTTVNCSPFIVTHRRDASNATNFPGGVGAYFSSITPVYLNSLFQGMLKAWIYGTKTKFGDDSYTGTGLMPLVSASANRSTQLQTLTGSTTHTGSTIYAVRFSPFEFGDGAQVAVDVHGGVYFTNNDWDQLQVIAGSNGPFPGYQMLFQSNNVMLLPSGNCVAAIWGVTSTLQPTAAQVNAMLDAVKADQNTVIFVNRVGKRCLQDIGKQDYLQMQPNVMGYSDLILAWNGFPIVLDENLSEAETYTLWN